MKMAAPEANLTTLRGPPDVNGNHGGNHPSRNLHNFNTFQFVSQLVSATPPYLFNMSSAPFPGNFFSDLLRRMAPRAGTPGMPPDANLQQHIRAALLAKGTPPPNLPQGVMPPPLDLAALSAHQRHQSLPPTSSSQEKGVKRSLFSDVNALSSCESENGAKRPRLEEPRDERTQATEGLNSPFLMQPPFLPSSVVAPPPDVMSHWSARASLLRPQMPIPSHIPPAPLDPYRLLLDLRLAGQLRTMAANQAMQHHKEPPLIGHPPAIPSLSSVNRTISPSARDPRPMKEETQSNVPIPTSQAASSAASSAALRGDDSRVSAFHPPGREAHIDMSDEEGPERRSNSRNSTTSSTSSLIKDGLGPQYILKNLTEIYRTIDVQRSDSDSTTNPIDKCVPELLHSASKLVKPSLISRNESTRQLEADKSNNNGGDCHNKPPIFKEERNSGYSTVKCPVDETRPKTPDSGHLKQEEEDKKFFE